MQETYQSNTVYGPCQDPDSNKAKTKLREPEKLKSDLVSLNMFKILLGYDNGSVVMF